MITKLSSISFQSNNFKHIPSLNSDYMTPESRANTVTIMGGSRAKGSALSFLDLCAKVTKNIVLSGKNILTGCGLDGIMGAAYKSAQQNSVKDLNGKPLQNLAIVVEPAWGDEDIENGVPIGKGFSEADRIEKFAKVSDTFLIFPGRSTTAQEATTLIQKNDYTKDSPLKKIILVGKDFWSDLVSFYAKRSKSGDLDHKVSELFCVVDSEKEIMKKINLKA